VKFDEWARENKTIIILNALNSKGVVDVHRELHTFASEFQLPLAIFCEDADSLNGAPTACGIVVPRQFYAVEYDKDLDTYLHEIVNDEGDSNYVAFSPASKGYEFIKLLRNYRLV